MNKQSNIVYFVADQMRVDSMAHMGNPAAVTPNLDALVAEGISFEHAYCQNPVCVPSRLSFLSGLYPHTLGHRTIHYLANAGEPNILRTMKNNGYEVIWVGRNDVIPGDQSKAEFCDRYYDAFCKGDQKDKVSDPMIKLSSSSKPKKTAAEIEAESSVPGYYSFHIGKVEDPSKLTGSTAYLCNYDWSCIEQALAYIDEKSQEPDSKPFFLYISLIYPHPEYLCEDPWYSYIDRSKLPPRRPDVSTLENKPSMLKEIARKQNLKNWGEGNFDDMRATYLAMVSRFDHQYGMVAQKLKDCGLYDNTNIFVFSDHGDYTGDYGIAEKVQNCFDDPVSNVPLLIKPSVRYRVNPRKSKALVELTDLTATVEELTGIKTEYLNFGKSLVHLFEKEEEHRDAVFCEGGRIHGETWAMERGHSKESRYWPRLSTQESEGPEHTKAVMCRMGDWKYVYRLYELDELYNMKEDPRELHNLAIDPQYIDLIKKMKIRMLDWLIETGDLVPDRKDKR